MNNCKNCKELVDRNYCPNCGQVVELRKIDKQYVIQEISDFLYANKGMLYTIKELLINPGESIKQYITENRTHLVKPVTFIFITSLIYTIVNQIFNISALEYHLQTDMMDYSTANLIINWMTIDYPGYANIISGLLMAFGIKIFFKKAAYNLFEIFILMCYVIGMSALFIAVAALIQSVTNMKFVIQVSTVVGIAYFIWAIGQFFDKKAVSYIKVFLAYVLTTLIISTLIIIIGSLIDILIKNQ